MGIPIIKIRRSHNSLIFIIEIPISGKTVFIMRPWDILFYPPKYFTVHSRNVLRSWVLRWPPGRRGIILKPKPVTGSQLHKSQPLMGSTLSLSMTSMRSWLVKATNRGGLLVTPATRWGRHWGLESGDTVAGVAEVWLYGNRSNFMGFFFVCRLCH